MQLKQIQYKIGFDCDLFFGKLNNDIKKLPTNLSSVRFLP